MEILKVAICRRKVPYRNGRLLYILSTAAKLLKLVAFEVTRSRVLSDSTRTQVFSSTQR